MLRTADSTSLRDRSFIEEMKADILRRAEEMSDDDEEAEDDVPYDVEIEEGGAIKIGGDGEESGEDVLDEIEEKSPSTPLNVETVLELAYIRDPKLFDRDSSTRKSKAREELRKQTGIYLHLRLFWSLADSFDSLE
jgi:activating signal cointegrator complex subunit 2